MIVRTLFVASLASTSLLVVSSALADSSEDRGLYLGVGTGFSSLENDREDVDDFVESGGRNYELDDDDNVWKGFAGYQFTPYFATEAFYTDLGRTELRGNDIANTNLESDAYGVSVVGQLPFTSWFTAFAKAGMAHWKTDVDGNLGDASLDLQDNDGTDPVYGVGAQLNFDPLLIRTEYERYDFDSDYKIDTFSASVGWRF
ncbi:hypothetical protein L861_04375 [Litchfieldella anticariensis FP35 = DSM 16096]|uniref:Outer membrane protein beta-barrel domain-containing protein n=1 Tax=Litchfieldella anticariensis (strain DSM 16096 / CECT 5854 / CIP 108499 / LMG 22089 / FP35) TaxID=1121939 RepID=S2KRP5_LITA3|nr:porin family protein [Halomonas anticariensis]EPC04565.1 hypothetical protein L861_04375 [Halomonas anticariensis FP35 = DSM 16096]